MNSFWMESLILPAAVVLDLILGDPRVLPHPIRWMGLAIEKLEPRFRQLPMHLTLSGGAMAVALIAGTWTVSWGLLQLAGRIHPLAGWTLGALMLYYALAMRSLAAAGRGVAMALQSSGLEAARARLRHIVGRQVDRLTADGVIRATVETVAENLVDGVAAPLFYACLGGPALAMTYKMVNTLDSMIGYRNPRYRDFGRLAARIDDLANYLPARLMVPVIALAAQLLAQRGWNTLQSARRYGRRHLSPNSGYPEACFAGALQIELGGPNYYHGQLVDKPYIGQGLGKARSACIPRACELMLFSGAIWTLLCWGATILMKLNGF